MSETQLKGRGYSRGNCLPILNIRHEPGGDVELWIETEDGEAAIQLNPKAKAKLIKLLTNRSHAVGNEDECDI